MAFEYVRQHYQVPACVGRRVTAYGEPGTIMADRGHYIGVVLDSDPKKRIRNYHPMDEMVYGEVTNDLPLRQFEVLIWGRNWWDSARQTMQVWAANHAQAKYKAYQELDDCFEDATAMFGFKARLA